MTSREDLIAALVPSTDGSHPLDHIVILSDEDAEYYADRILAVFEQAHTPSTPSDDEREALAIIIKQVSQKFGGPSIAEFANDPPIRKHYATADAILAVGFRRTVQGEPSADKRDAWRDAAAWALEDAADAIDRDFQRLPSWDASWKAGERTQDWEAGGTRMIVDTIDWLRARAATIREGAAVREEGQTTNEIRRGEHG